MMRCAESPSSSAPSMKHYLAGAQRRMTPPYDDISGVVFRRAVLDEMQSALADFRKTVMMLGPDLQDAYRSASVAAIRRSATRIAQETYCGSGEGRPVDVRIASYICSQAFLAELYRLTGESELFFEVHHRFFKHLIDLPLPFGLARDQAHEMLEHWRMELNERLSDDELATERLVLKHVSPARPGRVSSVETGEPSSSMAAAARPM